MRSVASTLHRHLLMQWEADHRYRLSDSSDATSVPEEGEITEDTVVVNPQPSTSDDGNREIKYEFPKTADGERSKKVIQRLQKQKVTDVTF